MHRFALAAVLTMALASAASADIVFTNIGAGGTPVAGSDFDPSTGYTVAGINSPNREAAFINGQIIGMRFTPTNNYTLTSYQLTFSNPGNNFPGGQQRLQLVSDAGGTPNFSNILDTKLFSLAGPGTTSETVNLAAAATSVVSGASYWLVVNSVNSFGSAFWASGINPPTTELVYAGQPDANGDPVSTIYAGPPPIPGENTPARQAGFRVQGNTINPPGIPEPGSFVLVGLGAAAAFGSWGWRRRNQKLVVAPVTTPETAI